MKLRSGRVIGEWVATVLPVVPPMQPPFPSEREMAGWGPEPESVCLDCRVSDYVNMFVDKSVQQGRCHLCYLAKFNNEKFIKIMEDSVAPMLPSYSPYYDDEKKEVVHQYVEPTPASSPDPLPIVQYVPPTTSRFGDSFSAHPANPDPPCDDWFKTWILRGKTELVSSTARVNRVARIKSRYGMGLSGF